MADYEIYLNDGGTPVKPKIDHRVTLLEDAVFSADSLNVKQYGAKGDGETDDTEALNEALAAAAGKVLYIPAGTYLTSTGLRIPAHTCVRGDGPWSTIIKLTSDKWETPCITNACNTTPAENTGPGDYGIRLENICADGNGYRANGSGSANHNGSAISWKNVHDLVQTNTRAIRGRLHCLDIASATYNNYYDATTADFTVGASTDVRVENFWGEDACTDDCLTTHYSGRLKFINCHLTGTKDRPYEKTFNQCGVEIDDGSFDVEMRGAYVTGFSWGIASKAHNEKDPSGVVKPALPARNVHFYDCVAEGNVVNWRVVNLGDAHNVGTTSITNCKSITPITPAENGSGADSSTIPTHLYFSGRTDGLFVNGFLCRGEAAHPAVRGILLYPQKRQVQDAEVVELRGLRFEDVALTSDAQALIGILGSWRKPVTIDDVSCVNCGDKPVVYVSGSYLHNVSRLYAYSSTAKSNAVIKYNSASAITDGVGFVSDVSHSGYAGALQVGSQYISDLPAGTRLVSGHSINNMGLYQNADSEAAAMETGRIGARYTFSQLTGGNVGTALGIGVAFASNSSLRGMRDDAIIGTRTVNTSADSTAHLVFYTREEGQGSPAPRWQVRAGTASSAAVHAFHPCADNAYMLGYPSLRVSQVYAGSGTINTSDEREKTSIAAPEDALMRAWGKVDFKSFQFTDAVSKKGDAARIHFGVIAQQVAEAFASEGLDATRYALFCHDKWEEEYAEVEVVDVPEVLDEETGEVVQKLKSHIEKRLVTPAGDRYGIRYEEALALECAYQRWRLDKLEGKLNN